MAIEVEILNLGFQVACTFDVAKLNATCIEFVKHQNLPRKRAPWSFLNQRSIVQGVKVGDFSKLVSPFKVSVKGHGEVDAVLPPSFC